MPRIFKWIAGAVAAVLLLALLLGIAFKVVFDTEAGTRWALARADAALPGSIDASDFDGTLWRGLLFSRLRYRDPDLELEAFNLTLKVNWGTIAAAQLTLQTVAADVVRYVDLAAPPLAPRPFELTMAPLPIDVSVEALDIPRFEYLKHDRSVEILDLVARDARIDGQALRVRVVSAITSDTAVSLARVRMTLNSDVPSSADIAWRRLADSWSGRGSADGTLASLRFEQTVAGPYPATVSGTLQWLHKTEPEVDANISWDLWTIGEAELDSGALHLRGVRDDYLADYEATLRLPADRQFQISGTARGNTQRLPSFTAHIDSPDVIADTTGSLDWAPQFAVEAQVHASNLNPTAFVTELHGSLDADARITIDDNKVVSLAELLVTGTLNDQPARATGNIEWAAQQQRCRACEIRVGSNVLQIDGESAGAALGDQVTLALLVDAPRLAELWPGLSGAATLDGILAGSGGSPQFSGDLHGQQLGFEEWFVDDLKIHSSETDLDALHISAELARVRRGNAELGSLDVSGAGQWQRLDVSLHWVVDGFVIRTDGEIVRKDGVINGTIATAQITEANSGEWHLVQPFAFEVAGNAVSVAAHNWNGASGGLQVHRFATTADEVSLAATIVNVPLHLANPWLPQQLTLLGSASAEIDLTQRAGLWSGAISWRQENTVMRIAELNDQITTVNVPRAELQTELRDGGMTATAWLSIDPGINGQLDIELAEFARDAPLHARLAMQGDQWDWLSAVFPEVDAFKGVISADVTADGPLNAPEFAGNVSWRDGGLLLPAMNVPLDKIEMNIEGASNGTAILSATAKAGAGDLVVNGRFNNLTLATRSVQFALSGTAAELINWPEYRVWATPDLTITGTAEGWQFAGKVDVPRANFVIPEIPVEAVRVSADVSILGDEQTAKQATRVSGETRLTLGEQVHVAALGLDTRLQGNLLLHMPADKATTAEGRVTLVEGVFAAYGQKLTIREGSTLTFTGPLNDPLVDVKAVRVIETFDGPVTAGIYLRGRAQNLTSTVFSEPSMADADALSYLVIGRPLSQATESEGGELSGAAVALGLRQATRLTEQIGQTIGLDQLSFAGDGGDTTALVAGKQINPRLYARYAYGVFSRLGTLIVRYKLSNKVTLEAGAGENQSIDIMYSVEKK